jgi:methylmalonyl-CoA/ethylmalonyl-CoA epimerase
MTDVVMASTPRDVMQVALSDTIPVMSTQTSGESASSAQLPGIIGVDHIGIAVADLEVAIAFYQAKFGFEVAHREINEEQGVAEAMIQVGPASHEVKLQLLAPLTPESAIARFLDKSGPGIQQLAYRVADIEIACAAVRERGMRLLFETPRRGTAGSRINFIHPKDAGGVLVELVQPATH